MKKVVLLVLDALGVGAVSKSNTLKSILQGQNPDDYSFFCENEISNVSYRKIEKNNNYIWKTSLRPKSLVPDSFIGHAEIVGGEIIPPKRGVYIENILDIIQNIFCDYGEVHYRNGIIFVGDWLVVGNNAETNPGLNINILLLKKHLPLSEQELDEISLKLLDLSHATRILTMYGNEISLDMLKKGIIEREIDGINRTFLAIPPIDIYNKNYKVKHYGKKLASNNFFDASIENGLNISLIGKVGKMFSDYSIFKGIYTGTDTKHTFDAIRKSYSSGKFDIVFGNIQNIDLAGHREDINFARRTLKEINSQITEFLDCIDDETIVILTADHGNDPLSGNTFHTVERVPLIIISKNNNITFFENVQNQNLSDIGKSVLHIEGVKNQEYIKKGRVIFDVK